MSRPPSGWAREVSAAPWALAIARTMDRPRPYPSPFGGAHPAEPLERLEQAVDLARRYRRAGVADPQGGLAGDLDR